MIFFLPSPVFVVSATIFFVVALMSANLTQKDVNSQTIDSVLEKAFIEIDSNTTKTYSDNTDVNLMVNNYVSSIVEVAKGTSRVGKIVGTNNNWFFSFFTIPLTFLFMAWVLGIPVLSLFLACILFGLNKAKKNKWSNPKPLQPFLES